MRSPRRHRGIALVLFATLLATPSARADDDAKTVEARSLFARGATLVAGAQWSEALASFERSAELRPHPITTYNVGACERALGRYTRARADFAAALAESDGQRGTLPPSLALDAKGYLDEIEALLAKASVLVEPPLARIAVDGRPLSFTLSTNGDLVGVAGLLVPGVGQAAPSPRFELVLDPGAHVLTLTREGFAPVIVNRTFAPKSSTTLRLELDRLPAVIHVSSNQPGAIVTVGGSDVGPEPVDVTRPAGSYQVIVKKERFETYRAQIVVKAGEEANLRAPLVEEHISIARRWWFWTAAAVVLAGAATATYFLVRAEETPVRPPLDGGGLGWTLQLR